MMHARKPLEFTRGPTRRSVALWVGGLILVALALLTRDALAQERALDPVPLRGVVLGEAGQPLVGAFVSFADSDWGSLTNEQGRFVLPEALPGLVHLRVEQLGYATLEWRGSVGPESADVMLRMEPQAILLEGLNVVTDRFRARRNATATSVLAYDRADLATAPQESVLRFIGARAGLSDTTCPGLRTSSLCFWSRGRIVEPLVYVDEAPVIGGLDYLDSFRPHDLYMVEVYSRGRHIRVYTTQFMERAAKNRLRPIPIF